MKKLLILLLCLPTFSHALVSTGAFVPYAFSTQGDEDGGSNAFSAKPMLSFGTVLKTPLWGQLFFPEVGAVLFTSNDDDYKKSVYFFIADLGHPITGKLIFRYGLGSFWTKISGDGGEVSLNDGAGSSVFYRPPEESVTSYNVTLNTGLEYAFSQKLAMKFGTYLFEFLDSDKRALSYSLGLTYYL